MDLTKYQSGAIPTPPTPPASPSVGFPTNGNPGTGTPATQIGAYWAYQVLQELHNLIGAAGLTPSNTDLTQLLQAIKKGFGQVWVDVTASRAAGTTYTNTNGFPLFVTIAAAVSLANTSLIVTINGTPTVQGGPTPSTAVGTGVFFVVPPGQTYSVQVNTGTATVTYWKELK